MNGSAFLAIAMACAPQIDGHTARALVAVESSFNPHAIGVVGGALVRQPRSLAEAVATARALHAAGWNFSVGLAQINVGNFERLGLSIETAFEPCVNLGAMQVVLNECFDDARRRSHEAQTALHMALSCYYSGNFSTGFEHGYVRRVLLASRSVSAAPPSPAATNAPSPVKEMQ